MKDEKIIESLYEIWANIANDEWNIQIKPQGLSQAEQTMNRKGCFMLWGVFSQYNFFLYKKEQIWFWVAESEVRLWFFDELVLFLFFFSVTSLTWDAVGKVFSWKRNMKGEVYLKKFIITRWETNIFLIARICSYRWILHLATSLRYLFLVAKWDFTITWKIQDISNEVNIFSKITY